ncbi:MAG: hypothetical protein ABGX12_06910 [Desulfurobacteriaceae bacterium]
MKDKTFDCYLQEALKELEKPCEEFDSKKCEELIARAVRVVIDNTTGETVQVKAQTPEKALAEALSKLTPGVKTVVEE